MFLKDVKKRIALLFSITILGFSVTGCGGGGGSSAWIPSESERVVIDVNNSEQVIGTVVNAIGIGFDPVVPLTKSVGDTSVLQTKALEPTAAAKQVLTVSQNRSASVIGEPIMCTDGGYITYTDTGAIFSDCNESGVIMDGTMTASGTETSGTLTLSNFTITVDEEILFYESMTIAFTLTPDNEIITVTMNGYSIISDIRTDYLNFTFSMSMDSSENVTFSIDGFIKTDCLGGWIEIRTTEDIQESALETCPTAGQIVISGNASSITIDFNLDGSVDVSGSVTDSYASCLDLPEDSCTII